MADNRIFTSQIPLIQQHKVHTTKQVSKHKSAIFAAELKQAVQKQTNLKISKHADLRMEQRNITIDPTVWTKVENKVLEAQKKGVNDSLVLLKNAAMIVNAKNNTVVTVMDRQEAGDQIFTNIDGTILID